MTTLAPSRTTARLAVIRVTSVAAGAAKWSIVEEAYA
jgi:hypothetical protein